MKPDMEGVLDPELLQRYAIVDKDADFEKALQNGGGKIASGGLVTLKSSKSKMGKHGNQKDHTSGKKRGKSDYASKSNKKSKSKD